MTDKLDKGCAPQKDASGAEADPLVGKVLADKYRILGKLGQGGMGAVYRAEHLLLDRQVAIKTLHRHLVDSEQFMRRFQQEAQTISKLSHPNIITLYDFGIEDNMPYLVMQFAEGETLREILKRGALDINKISVILEQTVSALSEAHSMSIIHRDLKPDNILVSTKADGSPSVHILDFGLAKLLKPLSGEASVSLTQTGIVMGTPKYMAPEQALEKELDARSDIYSLGVILYEMLTGEVPFDSTSPIEVFVKHLNIEPRPVHLVKPEHGIPIEVSQVVMKSLEKKPEHRHQSVNDMLEEFRTAVAATESPAGAKSYVSSLVSRRALLAALCSAAALLLISFLLLRGALESSPEAKLSEPKAPQTKGAEETETGSAADQNHGEPGSEASLQPQIPEVDVNSDKHQIDLAFEEGQRLMQERDFLHAGLKFREVLSRDKNHIRAHLSLGVCLMRLGKEDFALKHFNNALQIDANYAPAYYHLASLYSHQSDPENAIKNLKKGIELYPRMKSWPERDPDFDNIRSDPRYQALLQQR